MQFWSRSARGQHEDRCDRHGMNVSRTFLQISVMRQFNVLCEQVAEQTCVDRSWWRIEVVQL
jgi:hypothetical protein